MIATFLKNGHNYKRDYHIEVNSLSREVSTWWDEISETAQVGFGGPTGIYTMVVLMSWWCSFLENQSGSDRSAYNLIVDKLNSAILEAVSCANQSGAEPSSNSGSPHAKRTRVEEPLSPRKKQRA